MPESINILGIDYKISLVDVVDKTQLCFGQIDYFACEIRIDKNLPVAMQRQTLLHEVIHGICNLLGLVNINDDEGAVQGIASGLYSTFKDHLTFS